MHRYSFCLSFIVFCWERVKGSTGLPIDVSATPVYGLVSVCSGGQCLPPLPAAERTLQGARPSSQR